MPLIQYEKLRFHARIVAQIERANEIIREYRQQGFDLTLRQLYYQFVSRGLLANTQKNYKALGATISKARRAGLVDWEAIVDRTRFLRGPQAWDSPSQFVAADSWSYKEDRWKTQPHYVEVWFEKDALLGVFERPSSAWRVPILSCRGYVSDSEIWSAAQRLASISRRLRKPVTILHFGDHDPSGIDMTRDIDERLALFGADVSIERLALNMDQIEQYEPPPNPAKESDSRFAGYRDKFGDESWELDALDPKVLNNLVRAALMDVLDIKAWNKAVKSENEARAELAAISDEYEDVVERLTENGTIADKLKGMRREGDRRMEKLLTAEGLLTLDGDDEEDE
jgi:hypothetical protein